MQLRRKEKKMPKNIGMHYPNDSKGVTDGYPTHVPNGDGGAYGDYTKRSIADGGAGKRAKKAVLNQTDAYAWKYPNPTK